MKNIAKAFLYALPLILAGIATWHFTTISLQLRNILFMELTITMAVLFGIILIFGVVLITVYLKSFVYYLFKIDIRFRKKSNP